jgi:hypothetical protein
MSSRIRDDDADKPIPLDSPWASDAEQQDETLRLQEEVIAAARKLEQQSFERESWVSLERESRELEFREQESRSLPQSLMFRERTPLELQTPRPKYELAKVRPNENRFSLQESPRGIWAPTLDPVSMPLPPQERISLLGPGMVVGFVGAIGVAAAVALVIVQTMPIAPAPPAFSNQSGSGKNRSFAAVADNLPRIAAAESKMKSAELAAPATASVFATVPTGDAALAKPSIMTPPSSPTVEAAAKAEPVQGETAKIPEPRPSDSLSQDEIASLLKRGQDLIAASDLASGRLFLMRAAQAGNAEASLALAGTFDAAVLANLRAVGVQPDPAKARAWYMRAAEQGSLEAKRRLQQSALH